MTVFIWATILLRIVFAGQQIRTFSNTSGSSTQTSTMEGDGVSQIMSVSYEGLLEAQENGVLIIDVREPSEIKETGKLPGSIHIPSIQKKFSHCGIVSVDSLVDGTLLSLL